MRWFRRALCFKNSMEGIRVKNSMLGVCVVIWSETKVGTQQPYPSLVSRATAALIGWPPYQLGPGKKCQISLGQGHKHSLILCNTYVVPMGLMGSARIIEWVQSWGDPCWVSLPRKGLGCGSIHAPIPGPFLTKLCPVLAPSCSPNSPKSPQLLTTGCSHHPALGTEDQFQLVLGSALVLYC